MMIRREESLAAVHSWLAECSRPLLISAPPYSGKTCFVQQMSSEPDCVAVHFCDPSSTSSLDHSTLLRSLASQLVRRFPNLVLPYLSTVTLLADFSSALEQFLTLPLSSLPLPPRPLFFVIDDIQPSIFDLIFKLHSSVPSWLKLAVTCRSLPPCSSSLFSSFHELRLVEHHNELKRFVHSRLPQCQEQHVFQMCHGSWFYVEQVGRALDYGMLQADALPEGTEMLLKALCSSPALPTRLSVYLMLIKSSRRPPSQSEMLGVSQILVQDVLPSIQKDLEDLAPILSSSDPLIPSGSWRDFDADLSPFHSAWAEFLKMKKRKTPQNIVELAFHLAHSGTPAEDARKILASLAAGDLVIRCPVFDAATTQLLQMAGALFQPPEEQTDFVLLCSVGETEKTLELLSSTPSSTLSLGMLAASSRGHFPLIREMLSRRPEVAHASDGHWNALRAAACGNHLDVLDILIQRGINVDECGHSGRTALRAAAWAGHRSVVSRLLKAKADVEKRDSEGRTALMAAAFMDNHSIVQDLLQHGASVNQVDASGATALHLVLSNGRKGEQHLLTINTLLKHKANPNVVDSHGRACLHLAAYHGDQCMETVARLSEHIDTPDADGRTPLMLAASSGQLEPVQLLLSRGADIDAIDRHGRTALQLAAIHAHLPVVHLLLSLGADEAHKDNEGAVALHYAVRHPSVPLTRALSTPATLSSSDAQGNQPLLLAAQHPHIQVIEELIGSGASVEALSLDAQTALRVAASSGHSEVVRALAAYTTDWVQPDLDGTPLLHSLLINNQLSMASLLLSLGAPPSCRDLHGRCASHIVACRDDVSAARLLLRCCSFEESDLSGRTPLMTAVWAGHLSISAFLLQIAQVDPNAVDNQGASALSVAAQLGQREMVLLLLRFGSDPSLRDGLGRTAHDVARIAGRDHIRSLLQAATGSADSSGFGSMPPSPLDPAKASLHPQLTRRTSFVMLSAAHF